MSEEERKEFKQLWEESRFGGCSTTMVVVVLAIMLLCGCKTKEYVPVIEHHTEYITRTDTIIKTDSVYLKDSIYIHSKGDTVWYEKFHTVYKDRWRERIVSDTIMKADSIPVPYPVEKKLTTRERICMKIGEYSIYGIFVIVILYAIRLRFKRF